MKWGPENKEQPNNDWQLFEQKEYYKKIENEKSK
jgi:hypothetical protein